MEKKIPRDKKTSSSPQGDLGRWMMEFKPGAVTRIIESTVAKFDPEKLERYKRVMERRKNGS